MSSTFEIGDVVTLDFTIKVDDVPTDATVDLTITLPDGSTASPSISHPGTGEYTTGYIATQDGVHTARWVATGAATAAQTEMFTVGGVVSLEEAKQHLDKKSNVDDAELTRFVDAANTWVTEVVTTTAPAPVRLATLELIRHLWRTQRGPITAPLDGDEYSGGITGFSIPNRVRELLLPWLKPGALDGSVLTGTPLGSFPDPPLTRWPDPADRCGW